MSGLVTPKRTTARYLPGSPRVRYYSAMAKTKAEVQKTKEAKEAKEAEEAQKAQDAKDAKEAKDKGSRGC